MTSRRRVNVAAKSASEISCAVEAHALVDALEMRRGVEARAQARGAQNRSSIAAVEPFPFVPAMCTERNARSGWPSRSHSAVMLARSNFVARACCGEASSRPRESRYRTDSS